MNKILQAIENSLLLSSKICSRCRIEKDLNDFRKCPVGTFGRNCYCKLCQNIISREHYQKNKAKRLEQVKKWNSEHPELVTWNKENYNLNRKKKKDN
jgi:hypothetical protein